MSIVKATHRQVRWTVALASAACLLALGAANAGEVIITHVTVSYRDLDVSTPSGAQTLYVRIQRAAGEVCTHQELNYQYEERAERLCRQATIAHAVTDVHSPQLTALYDKNRPKLTAMSQ
jgi:UrcA family protein